jgi:DNA-binding Lrp family transcriptional regulator
MNENIYKYKVLSSIKASAIAKIIYMYLCDIAVNRKIQISIGNISDSIKFSPKVISRSLHRLESSGYISIEACFNDDGGQMANFYVLR